MKRANAEREFLKIMLTTNAHGKDWYVGLKTAWYFSGITGAKENDEFRQMINDAFSEKERCNA